MKVGGLGRARWWRWLAAAALLLLALHSVRVAWARSKAATRPQAALAAWPGYPDALFSLALADIGAAAREGQPPPPQVMALVRRGARQAPLAPEPLWVAAAARMEGGDLAGARRLLEEAIKRDARAPAARFLLADVAIRQGELELALSELAALERRLGGVTAGFAPALVAFLRQPGAAARVGGLLAGNPPLRDAVMKTLAEKPGDFPLLLALARPGDERAAWFEAAMAQKLGSGEVGEVQQLFRRVLPSLGAAAGSALTPWNKPMLGNPFAWRFPESRGGLAELVPGGPLRLVHYGREESVLAEHRLLLAPGRYRLEQRFAGNVPAGAFEWRLRCLAGNQQVAGQAAGGAGPGVLAVPAGCPAQSLQLVGLAADMSGTVRADLLEVRLQPEGTGR